MSGRSARVIAGLAWLWMGLPLLVGIGWLFFDGRAALAWLLVVLGAAIILTGIIANLHLYFRPTSLLNTLMMLGLLFGGLGLIARALRAH